MTRISKELQGGSGRLLEIDANKEIAAVEAEVDVRIGPRVTIAMVPRSSWQRIVAGVDPLEKRLAAVDFHVKKYPRQGVGHVLSTLLDRPAQFRGRRLAQQEVNVLQMLAEQIIEQRVLAALE